MSRMTKHLPWSSLKKENECEDAQMTREVMSSLNMVAKGQRFESLEGDFGYRANTKGECQVEWSSPGTRYRLGANMLGFGKIPGGSVSGYVLDTVEVII